MSNDIVEVVIRGFDPLCEPGRTTTPRELALGVMAALAAAGFVIMPRADYGRLLEAAESDDMIVICETCGAWLDRDDPATATLDDFTGCWKAAAHRAKDSHLCRSYRAIDVTQSESDQTARKGAG